MAKRRLPATSFWSFLRAFGGRWFTAMSGPASVPFVVASLFVDPPILKVLFGVIALVCACFSSYWVWRTERIERLQIERSDSEAAAALGNLRRKGVLLQNRAVTSASDLEQYERDVFALRDEALAIMRGVASESDVAWFRDLSTFPVKLRGAINAQHLQAKNTVVEFLDRMDKISRRMESHYWGRPGD
jgi:hypothetical protein